VDRRLHPGRHIEDVPESAGQAAVEIVSDKQVNINPGMFSAAEDFPILAYSVLH
jgi:hypothetical protein